MCQKKNISTDSCTKVVFKTFIEVTLTPKEFLKIKQILILKSDKPNKQNKT